MARTHAQSALAASLLGLAVLSAATTASAADVYSKESGDWNVASTWQLGVVPTNGDKVFIFIGTMVTIPVGLKVTVDGTLAVQSGGTLVIAGTLENNAFVNMTGGSAGSVSTGTIHNNAAGTFTVDGTEFQTSGTFDNAGKIVIPAAGSRLVNVGTLTNTGTVENYNFFVNKGVLVNKGTFTNITTSFFTNDGTLTNEKDATLRANNDFDNNKTFVNLGFFFVGQSGGMQTGTNNHGSFENRGTTTLGFRLWNHPAGIVTNAVGATISHTGGPTTNEGLIENYGAMPTSSCVICVIAQRGVMKNHCGATYGKITGDQPVVTIPCDAGVEDATPDAAEDTAAEDTATSADAATTADTATIADTASADTVSADTKSTTTDSTASTDDAATEDTKMTAADATSSDSSSSGVVDSGAPQAAEASAEEGSCAVGASPSSREGAPYAVALSFVALAAVRRRVRALRYTAPRRQRRSVSIGFSP